MRMLPCVVLSCVALAACAGAQSPGAQSARARGHKAPAQPFPSRDSLAKIAEAPAPAASVQKVASAAEWNVTIEAVDAPSAAETRFAQATAKTDAKVTYSKELRCAAREVARFQVEHGAAPNERLKRFMVAACGATNQEVGAFLQGADVPADVPDDQLLAQWQKSIEVPSQIKGSAVGVAMARNRKRAVFAVVYASPEPGMTISAVDANGQFTITGAVPKNSEHAIGLVNQGEVVAPCEADPAMPLPLYTFHCQMAPGDKSAWVEVAARPHDRLLLHSAGLGLARRDQKIPVSFTATARAPRPVKSPADLQVAILEGVNRARGAAKLNAVSLAPGQSKTNDRLAPHFFAASFGHDPQKGDVVGLGLVAGWEVEGTIKRGNLFSALLSGANDANDWVDFALEVPMGRYTMLDADAKQIAVGAASSTDVGGLGAVVTSYDMFTSADHHEDVALVFQAIQKARVARGLLAPIRIDGGPAFAQQARLVNEGHADAENALDAAMVAVRDRSQRAVHGWVFEANQLDALQLPPELLGAGPLELAIEVTHTKEPGAAWGSYVVFLVTPSTIGPAAPTQITASL